MNNKEEASLKYAAASLSRAHESKNSRAIHSAHRMIKEAVADIYKNKIDAPTVFRVEQILNDEQANVLGKRPGIYEQIKDLTGQVEIGSAQYAKFSKDPRNYVDIADASRFGADGQQFRDGVPRDPVRNTFIKFREQLMTELMHREGDPIPDREQTNIIRLDAAIKAERQYIKKYLDNRKTEPEQKKEEHLQRFDRRMKTLMRKIEDPQQEKQPERQKEKQQEKPQERQREEAKREEKQPKRSKGLGLSR